MKRTTYRKPHLLAAFTLSSLVASLSAQIVWDGSGDGTTYEDAANWVGGVAPADDTTTDVAQFNGDLSLSSARSVSGIDINAATVLSGSGSLTLGADGITGASDLSLSGTGSVYAKVADGALNYTGNIVVGSGTTLFSTRNAIKQDNTLPKTTITLDGGTLSEDGDHLDLTGRDIVLTANGGTLRHINNRNIFGGYVVSGAGQLTMEGAGTTVGRVQLTETNTYTGGSVVTNGGQAWIYNDNSLGANDTAVSLDTGGTLFMANNNNLGARAISVGTGGGRFSMNGKGVTIGGVISGGGNLDISGNGTIELNTNSNTLTGDVSISGTEVRLNGGGGADHLGTGTITLDNGAFLKNRNTNVTVNNDIIIGSGGGKLEVGWNNRNITSTGTISGDGLLTIGNDSSSVRLSGANTYTGGTEVLGKINAESGTLGTGPVTLNDGVAPGGDASDRGFFQNWNNGDDVFDNDLIIHANGGGMKAGWNANLVINGVTSGSGELRIFEDSGVVVLSNTANTFNGNIAFDGANSRIKVGSLESGNYTKTISGAGTIEYDLGSGNTQIIASSSTMSYTGSTVVNSGNLQMDGNLTTSQIFVRNGARVSGIGTLGVTTIEAGGTIAPGQSPGTIMTSDFTLAATATYEAEITGAANDTIAVTGAADVTDGVLNLILSGTYTFGQEFILIDNDGADAIVGLFSGLTEGATAATHEGMDLIASYSMGDGNDFGLTAIPEPSSALLAGLGALALLRRRRA